MSPRKEIMFDHEKLDVYRLSIEYVAWSYKITEKLSGPHRHARDQLLRASQSIPQNIAEGNGKRSLKDRNRFFDIARGSTLECASILDILEVGEAISIDESKEGKKILQRIVSMLTRLSQRTNAIGEETASYEAGSESRSA